VGTSSRTTGAAGDGDSAPRRLAREVSSLQATLLARLHEELSGEDPALFATAAQRLAEEFGSVTATAVGALWERQGGEPAFRPAAAASPSFEAEPVEPPGAAAAWGGLASGREPGEGEHHYESLYRPGEMRRRLDQLVEANKRYGHPFGLVVFDVDGPGARNGHGGGSQEAALAIVAAALYDSIRIVDEAFPLEDEGICVLAPNQATVAGVQMAERLMRILDELEASGGLRIAITAGVVACPEHGTGAEGLLHKADEAMWRARAVGQPVGVGPLEPVQDR
jgi:diguanylate cyclase (GGDEF)-like protein